MYKKYYKLTVRPFENTPDPEFLYLSKQHREVLSSLVYGIESAKGFILVAGSVGTGKTTLVRSFLEEIGSTHIVISITNPHTTFDDIFGFLAKKLGVSLKGRNRLESIDEMRWQLEEMNDDEKRVVIVIDEAHLLSEESLDEIRLLSNIENEKIKLIQIVLVGQNEIFNLLARDSQQSLRQRIVVSRQLIALDKNETFEYVRHRLQVACCHIEIFDKDALNLIWKHSQGTPRIINQICDNSLLIGYALGEKVLGSKIVREVLDDMKPVSLKCKVKLPSMLLFGWKAAGAVVCIIVFGIVIKISFFPGNKIPEIRDSHGEDGLVSAVNIAHGFSPVMGWGDEVAGEGKIKGNIPLQLRKKMQFNSELTASTSFYQKVGSKSYVPESVLSGDSISKSKGIVPQKNGESVKVTTVETYFLPESVSVGITFRSGESFTVQPNECLSDIVVDEYGTISETLLDLVLMANKGVRDINQLTVGETIMLPEISRDSMVLTGEDDNFYIHYASFRELKLARLAARSLRNEGKEAFISTAIPIGTPVFRVYIGSYPDRITAEKSAMKLDFKYLPFLNIQEAEQVENLLDDQQQERESSGDNALDLHWHKYYSHRVIT